MIDSILFHDSVDSVFGNGGIVSILWKQRKRKEVIWYWLLHLQKDLETILCW